MIDKDNKYSRMQKNFYNSHAPASGDNVHREHDANDDYWQILLGDCFDDNQNTYLFNSNNALDFGSGCGRNVFNLWETDVVWNRTDGVDISEATVALSNAQAKTRGWENKCIFYANNGVDLSILKTDEYMFVMSTIVFQHIAVHEIRFNIMKEIYRVMKHGGLFSFQMGFGNSPGTVSYFENHYNATGTNSECDVRVENPEDLIGDLKKIGFTDITYEIKPSFSNTLHKDWIFVKAWKPAITFKYDRNGK